MMTPETIDLDKLTKEQAIKIMQGMRKSVAFLFDALDQDGDGRLSPAEIDAAPDVLRALGTDGDGGLNESELEGHGFHFMPGRIRQNAIVRMLDLDGDLYVTAEDIADAPNRIRRLDRDKDGIVRREDVIRIPVGTLAQRVGGIINLVKMMLNLSYYSDELTGEVLPGSDLRGMSDGYTLIYESNDFSDVQMAQDVSLLGADGKPVHVWKNQNHATETCSAELHTSGLLLRAVCVEDVTDVGLWFPVGAHGTVQLVDWDGTVVWQYTRCARGKHCLHHGVSMMPNGNILVISYEALTRIEAIALGWEPQPHLNVQRGDGYVWTERILELEPNLEDGSTKVVWEWAIVDHNVQAFDAAKPNYGKVSENRPKINFNYTRYANYIFTSGQLYHCNSAHYNAERDEIVISSADFSEFWIVDHSHSTEETRGKKGDLLFRWGNAESYSDEPPTFGRADKQLFWQHDALWLGDDVPHTGDLILINNGAMRGVDGLPNNDDEKSLGFGTAYTNIMEVALPKKQDGRYDWDGDVAITWSYEGDPPQNIFAPFMSGVNRTPSGNTVFALGHNKRVIEVTPDGDVVADFRVSGPGNTFRVRRYGFDFPGLTKLKQKLGKQRL